MAALHTLKKRRRDPYDALYRGLNELVQNPDADIGDLLFGTRPDT